jgi:5-methyltetrahydrofolate--homocysteine methyltransferase
MTDRLRAALARGPLLLDAAMGTRLIARGLDLRSDDPSLWNLSRPKAVTAVHRRDVEAGSDALLTNTFGANRCWLARLGSAPGVELINRRAVALARQAAGPDRLVIGGIGPTATEHPGASREQAEVLADAEVDALLLETHRADQAGRALRELGPGIALPVLVSLIVWPEPLADTVQRLADLGAAALGGNCQFGMEPALRMAEELRRVTDLPLLVKPSAGRPGEPPADPESFAAAVPRLLSLGVKLIGGCCGTTETHVAALRAALSSWE